MNTFFKNAGILQIVANILQMSGPAFFCDEGTAWELIHMASLVHDDTSMIPVPERGISLKALFRYGCYLDMAFKKDKKECENLEAIKVINNPKQLKKHLMFLNVIWQKRKKELKDLPPGKATESLAYIADYIGLRKF